MRVERSDDLHAFLTSEVRLGNLDLSAVIKDAINCHWLHRPLLFELVQVLASPNVVPLVQWGDVLGFIFQVLLPSLSLVVLVISTSVLVLGCLVHEHCRGTVSGVGNTYLGQEQLLP